MSVGGMVIGTCETVCMDAEKWERVGFWVNLSKA